MLNILLLSIVVTGSGASVTDGDTIELQGETIRLHGIDAPEDGQYCTRHSGETWLCGSKAAFALADRIGDATLKCEGDERDRYGRLIATCYMGGEDINAWMVRSGWAVAYSEYSTKYLGEEQSARLAGENIWSGPFVMPWNYRNGGSTNEEPAAAVQTLTGYSGGDKDCADVGSHAEAQRFYEMQGPSDPHRLDRDKDGLACESLD